MELISIIIPVYNLEDYIEKTLDSVFAQTYKNIEVIAVDDGSKDNSGNILDDYAKKESRLHVIHKENGGVTSARIRGIEEAKGEYIGFVDGDDLTDSDMYKRLINNALKYNADISHCGYRLITEESTEYFYNTGDLIIQDKEKGIYDLLEGSKVEPGLWNKLFHKRLFRNLLHENSVMDFSLKINEDLLMNYCLFKEANSSVYEDFCPYQYIKREGSASVSKMNGHKLYDPVKAGKIIFEDLKTNEKLVDIAASLYVTKLLSASTYYEKSNKDIIEFRKKAQKDLKKFLPFFVRSKNSFSRKIQTVFAAFLPKVYSFIHNVYLKH